jgi:hypothetical protein
MFHRLLLAAALSAPLLAIAQHAHEHGVAKLDVSLDGGTLLIALDSPLDNLAGFEHAPRNDKQRAALAKMEENLRAAERLFRLPAAAECKPAGAKLESPYPASAGPSAKAAPTGDSKKDGETHADVEASWEFTCAKPAALDGLEAVLFDTFRGMKRIKVQTVTAKGQGSATLTPAKRTLRF